MLTVEQLKDVMFKRSVFIDFIYDRDWAHFHSSLEDDGTVTLSIFIVSEWVPIYYLANWQTVPLIDSPAYVENFRMDLYYVHMANRFIRYWRGLISPIETTVKTTVWTYCNYCKKKLTSYRSLMRGFGPECSAFIPPDLTDKYIRRK